MAVANELAHAKRGRQLVFASHIANLVVNRDAVRGWITREYGVRSAA